MFTVDFSDVAGTVLKFKKATWKVHAEAIRRYRQRHKGSLDRAEGEMDDLLKPKIGQVLKTSIDKSPSADLYNSSEHAKEKGDAKELDTDMNKGNPPSYTAAASETEKKRILNVAGRKDHQVDARMKTGENKEQIKSQKTSHEHVIANQHSEAVESRTGGENVDLESAYDENASVFDDELVFDNSCIACDTSSMSVDIVTDCATSKESFTDIKPQEDVCCCGDDSQNLENGKLSLKPDGMDMTENSEDKMTLSLNALRDLKPAEQEELRREKHHCVSKAPSLIHKTGTGTLKTKICFPETPTGTDSRSRLGKCSRGGNTNGIIVPNLHPGQLGNGEAVHENLIHDKLSPFSSQKTSQSEVVCRCDSVPADKHSSSSSSHSDSNWHLPSLFDSRLATPENTTVSNSSVLSESSLDQRVKSNLHVLGDANGDADEVKSLDRHLSSSSSSSSVSDWHLPSLFDNASNLSDDASSDAGEVKSNISLISVGSHSNHRRSAGNSNNEEKKSSGLQYLSSSNDGSDWHFSLLYEESARDCSGRLSTGRNSILKSSSSRNSRSSISSSEWHIKSLLFDNSDLSSRQLSGDLHAQVLLVFCYLVSFFQCDCIHCITCLL